MKDFWEKEGKMIKIFGGMFLATFIFFQWLYSLGSGSWLDLFVSIVYSTIFFVILFVICAIVFGEHYER